MEMSTADLIAKLIEEKEQLIRENEQLKYRVKELEEKSNSQPPSER